MKLQHRRSTWIYRSSLLGLCLVAVAGMAACKKKPYDPLAGGGTGTPQNAATVKGPGVLRYIAAPSGLRMRNKPGLHGNKLMLIPFGTPVRVLKEGGKSITVEGRSGRWSQVNHQNVIGWVFSGFLTKTPPSR